MKNQYEKIEIAIYTFHAADIVTLSNGGGVVDGDETKYPIPDGWAQ